MIKMLELNVEIFKKNVRMIAESLCTNLRNIQNYLVSICTTRKQPLLCLKQAFLMQKE